ncbi:hypothetical protein RDWZM_000272 [Blomia tropicalis]|uniref:TBC1 domain family member 2B-like n=1 Tax=Blomia tropicalis TaxID=40697 RepID=A0A9Q0MBX0_BLOTA|nr:hypothetical protein RDWZM_000272 [Blomia tropicalis]
MSKSPLDPHSTQQSLLNIESSSTQINTNQLQGYLLKHSTIPIPGNVPIGSFRKKRWFVCSLSTGKLYYYRTREDVFPIGEIDLRSASFVIRNSNAQQLLSSTNSSQWSQYSQPSSSSSSFVFDILSGTKTVTLEASSSADGFQWVKNLQIVRQYLCNQYLGTETDLKNNNDSLQLTINNPNILTNQDSLNSTSDIWSQSKFYCDNNSNSLDVSVQVSNAETQSQSSSIASTKPKIFGALVNRIRTNQIPNQESSLSTMESCPRCKRLEEQLITMNHDRFALEDEMKTNREVIKILQEQLRIFNSEKANHESCPKTLTSDPIDGQLSNEFINLKIQCKCLQNENDKLLDENRSLLTTKSVLQEMLESRDRTLVSLTHEVYDLESKNSRMATRAELEREYLQDEMPRKVQQRIEQLEDTVTAFEQQNEFLNTEIIELKDIRHRMELKEKQTQAKLCEVEAKCSQIQSKLLSLLKELNQCILDEERASSSEFHGKEPLNNRSSLFVTNESVKILVNRLLEESSLDIPLSWRPGNKPRNWSASDSTGMQSSPDYDELGFFITNSHTQTYDLVLEPDKNEISWRSKWDQFISNLHNVEDNFILRSLGLKQMLRLGVPQDYRCKMWRMLVNQRIKEKRSRFGEDYYESLLRTNRSTGSPQTASKVIDPSAKQIELDLLRTLPNNKHFDNLESDGISRLRRVLIAYSLHNRTVGYCQGLNRLAAVTLLFMPEEDSFWCLVAIVETIMPPDYFGRNLMGAHVDQYVLRDLITEKLPNLSQHMEQHHIEISLFAWFLTVFVDNIPVSVYLHIWDVFLYEGSKVLFRFALAILKMHEQDLLQMKDSASFNQYLRTLDERHFNLKRLSEIAFRELNPFSSSKVRAKRNHYTNYVMEELRKIELIRDSIKSQNNNERTDNSSKSRNIDPKQGANSPSALISFDDNDSDD